MPVNFVIFKEGNVLEGLDYESIKGTRNSGISTVFSSLNTIIW